MKKVLYGFILLIVLFIGVSLGEDSTNTKANLIKDKTKEFEEEIVQPNNNYYNSSPKEGNIDNKLAKAGGNVISEIFDFSFGLLKDVIG